MLTVIDSPKHISTSSILRAGIGLDTTVTSIDELLVQPYELSVITTAFEIVPTGVADQST